MNWKNVLFLMRVERKSGRLLRGIKATRYRENSFLANWPYWLALGVGIAAGLIAGVIYNAIIISDSLNTGSLQQNILGVFVALPTLVLVYNLVLTLLQQIQRSGVKVSTQMPYWLPITWQEHTLASILASLMGFPLASVLLIISGLVVFSFFSGLIVAALLTSAGLLAAAFMASAITEVLRVLQVRFIGAVYKSSGRAAVWVRFIGSLGFFIVFYALYFYVTSGGFQFVQTVTQTQNAVWFVPVVWLGITLYYFLINISILNGLFFLALSALFIAGLYGLAVTLNKRFGLYEPPAIKVSKSGLYTPKTGLLGKLGFSSTEAALIRKDLKAFTRRRELITVFIAPIVISLVPLTQSIGNTSGVPTELSLIFTAMIFLFPASFMVMSLGNFIIGEEGQAVWRIYASPISAKNLVKSKYFFIVLFSVIIMFVTGCLGIVIYHPSFRTVIVGFCEAFFLILALGSISLTVGFRGADFNELPRPRMVRQSWALINLVACVIAGSAVLATLAPSVASSLISPIIPDMTLLSLDPYVATAISGVIAIVIAAVFYRFTLDTARDFLRKAEV